MYSIKNKNYWNKTIYSFIIPILSIIFFFLINKETFGTQKTLIIATEATYPPYEYLNNNGEIIGFDIDIIKEICKKIGRKYKVIHQPSFESLILGLQSNKFDIAIGAITINEERKKQVSFSDIYFQDNISFIFKKDSNLEISKKSLKGKILGLQSGTVFEKYVLDNFSEIVTIKLYNSVSEGLLDLKNDRIDGYVGDGSILKYWILKENNKQFKTIDVFEKKYISKMAIAVNKNNTKLLKLINQALSKIKSEKSLENISKDYFGTPKFVIKPFIIQILRGVLNTIKIALFSLFMGLFFTLFFVSVKLSNYKFLSRIINIITFIIKALPELLIILITYFGIPIILKKLTFISVEIPPTFLAILGLSLIFASYATSLIYEAYINIPLGQKKAAVSLGIPSYSINRRIIFPQVLKNSLPGLNNLWLILLKDTSLVAFIGIYEIMNRAKLAASTTGKHFLFYLIAAAIYLSITTIFNLILNKLKRRF